MEKIAEEPDNDHESKYIPTYLVMNKIDLCANKRKLKVLVNEIEDLGRFDRIFYTSAESGYGVNDLVHSLVEESYSGPWEYHPKLVSNMSEVRKFEEIMRGVIFN